MEKTLYNIVAELQNRGRGKLSREVLVLAKDIRDLKRFRLRMLEDQIEQIKRAVRQSDDVHERVKLLKKLRYLVEERDRIGPNFTKPNHISPERPGITRPNMITRP